MSSANQTYRNEWAWSWSWKERRWVGDGEEKLVQSGTEEWGVLGRPILYALLEADEHFALAGWVCSKLTQISSSQPERRADC